MLRTTGQLSASFAAALPTLLVCVAMIAVAGLSGMSSTRVATTLDENWRGLYDILVTPAGESFGGDDTGGLVDASFVATAGEGGISLRDLRRIRAVEEVEVAAPIGMVGMLRDKSMSPALWISDPVGSGTGVLPDDVVVARVTMTVEDVRTSEPRTVARNVGYVGVRSRADLPQWSPEELSGVGFPNGFAPLVNDQGFFVPLGQLPAFSAAVVAVDPVAERALLGEERSAFLRPLETAPAERDLRTAADSWRYRVDEDRFLGAWADIQAMADGSLPGREAVPLVVSEPVDGSLRMTVEVEQASSPPDEIPTSVSAMDDFVAGATFGHPETMVLDVSGVTAPFSSADLFALWPGSSLPDDGLFSSPATDLFPSLVGRPDYVPTGHGTGDGDETPTFRVFPRNLVTASGDEPDPAAALGYGADPDAGLTRAYRTPVTPQGASGFTGAAPAPLGTFDPDQLVDTDRLAASYVPSGLLPTTPTTVLDGPLEGEVVAPGLSNLGFVTASPGAFTDLAGGAALRGETPIDAVRVRVGGITSYSAQDRRRVLDVAARIEGIGMDATVVAGSSPQPVEIFVPDYYPGRDGPAADLGQVSQEWTTLGAAVVVERALSDAGRDLAVGAVAATGAGFVVTSLLRARGLRRTVSVLDLIGWRRRRVRRFVLARHLPHLAAILAAVGLGSVLAPPEAGPGLAVMALLAVVLTAVFVGVSMRDAAPSLGPRRHAWTVQTVGTYAVRRVRSAPLTTGLVVGGGAALAAVTALGWIALQENLRAAGSTRLADSVLDSATGSVAALGVTGVAAAVLLLVTGRRLELRQRAAQERVLVMMGLPRRVRRAIVLREELLMSGALVGVGVAVAALVHLLAPGQAGPVVALASVLLLVVAGRWATSSVPDREGVA